MFEMDLTSFLISRGHYTRSRNFDPLLTPKVLLSPIGAIWTLGRLVQFQFILRFFEIFMEDVVFYKLHVHIIFSKIGHFGKKL